MKNVFKNRLQGLQTPSLIFAGKAGAYLSEAPSGAPLKGRPLALPTNIRLGWGRIFSRVRPFYERAVSDLDP
jgi:hypothetical protein